MQPLFKCPQCGFKNYVDQDGLEKERTEVKSNFIADVLMAQWTFRAQAIEAIINLFRRKK